MTQQTIGVGTVANDGTGDALRAAMVKINANFTELYSGLLPGQVLYSALPAATSHTGKVTYTTDRGFHYSDGVEWLPLGGPSTALAAIRQAAHRRVDILMIGDSNQVFGAHGWDWGIQHRLHALYGMYATGAHSARDANGSNSGSGYHVNLILGDGQSTGAPAALDDSMEDGVLYPLSYYYYPTGSAGTATGLSLESTHPQGWSLALRGHVVYGTFDSGAGTLNPAIRLGYAPYTVLATSPVISTNAGAYGIKYATLDLAAGARGGNLEFKARNPSGANITGPALVYYLRVEFPTRRNGVSCHTIYGVGGHSLYDMALQFQTAKDAQIELILSEARRLQVSAGQKPLVVVMINSGANDRNEATASIGPARVADADSPEAYVDNLQAIVSRIEGVYGANWDIGELHFLIMPTHRVAEPDDTELVAYRAAAATWALTRDRTSVVDLAAEISEANMLAGGHYASGGADRNHLTQVGYEALAALVF